MLVHQRVYIYIYISIYCCHHRHNLVNLSHSILSNFCSKVHDHPPAAEAMLAVLDQTLRDTKASLRRVGHWERSWHLGKGVQNLWLMVWYGLKHSFGGDCIIIFCLVVTGTWSLLNFIFPNSWDDDPSWRTHIFQRGWNHQPVFNWVSGHFRNRLIGGTYQEPKLELPPF